MKANSSSLTQSSVIVPLHHLKQSRNVTRFIKCMRNAVLMANTLMASQWTSWSCIPLCSFPFLTSFILQTVFIWVLRFVLQWTRWTFCTKIQEIEIFSSPLPESVFSAIGMRRSDPPKPPPYISLIHTILAQTIPEMSHCSLSCIIKNPT